MITDKVSVRKHIDYIWLNQDDWELYSTAPGVDSIAGILNERFMHCVNNEMTRAGTRQIMANLLRKYSYAGADDSEPHWVLEDLLNYVYGDEK